MTQVPTQFAQVADAGIQLIVQFVDQDNVIIDMSAAIELQIKIGLPDGTSEDHDAEFLTDGTDGKIFYTTTENDLLQVGYYVIQGKASIGGNAFSTRTTGILQVFANVDDN